MQPAVRAANFNENPSPALSETKKKDESIYFLVIGRRDFTRAYYPGARYTLFSSVSKLSWRKFYPGFFHIKVPGSKGL